MLRNECLALALIGCLAQLAAADDVLLNEWNAVGSERTIGDGDSFFGTELAGNGGNWFELIAVKDVDMRGWELNWTEQEPSAGGDPFSEGAITLSNSDLWADIKAGSIITIIETEDGGGQGVSTGTDTSYDPAAGDWTINVSTFAELDAASPLLSTVTNDGAIESANEFSVGNDDWQMRIFDAGGVLISGPIGEGSVDEAGAPLWAGGGVSSSEAGSLEGPARGSPLACWESISASSLFYDDTGSSSFGQPNVDFLADDGTFRTVQDVTALRGGTPEGFGDFDSSGEYDAADLTILSDQIAADNHSPCFDLTEDGVVDSADFTELIVRGSFLPGDADLDGDVDEVDFEAWNANKFTSGRTWQTGDFSGDGSTDVTDFNLWNANKTIAVDVLPAVSIVPEPSSVMILAGGALLLCISRRQTGRVQEFDVDTGQMVRILSRRELR